MKTPALSHGTTANGQLVIVKGQVTALLFQGSTLKVVSQEGNRYTLEDGRVVTGQEPRKLANACAAPRAKRLTITAPLTAEQLAAEVTALVNKATSRTLIRTATQIGKLIKSAKMPIVRAALRALCGPKAKARSKDAALEKIGALLLAATQPA